MVGAYKAKDQEFLKLRRSILAHFNNADITTFSKDGKVAFYINAYNFMMMNTIVVNSQQGLVAGPFKIAYKGGKHIFDQPIVDFGNEKIIIAGQGDISLNDLENEIIRKELLEFKDARIHFVLNCSALGCPALF